MSWLPLELFSSGSSWGLLSSGGPGGPLHPKPGGHPAAAPFAKQGRQAMRSKVPQETQSGGGSRLQVHQKQQLQG